MFKTKEKDRIEKTLVDEDNAQIAAARYGVNFARLRAVQKALKERNLPFWKDLIKQAMNGGNLMKLYIERYANQMYINLSDVNELNKVKEKFNCISDNYWEYHFPARFVVETEEGFEVNERAIQEEFLRQYTVTLTDEQQQAITSICEALEVIGLAPGNMRLYFYQENGKILPIKSKIIELWKK